MSRLSRDLELAVSLIIRPIIIIIMPNNNIIIII